MYKGLVGMKVELTRFKVKKEKEERVKVWMELLNSRMDEVLETLEGERIYVENIFEEIDGDTMYLYWFSIQGEGGIEVRESNHEIDRLHVQFWRECIDETYKGVAMTSLVMMLPERVREVF